MKPAFVAAAVAAIVLVGSGSWLLLDRSPPVDQIARGRAVYTTSCASCHGANLEGQPAWQQRLPNGRMLAPPHDATGHTWHHPDQDLVTIVRDGLAAIVPGYETDMPAFGDTLTDDEIDAVLAFIKSTWSDREREYQAARTADRLLTGDR